MTEPSTQPISDLLDSTPSVTDGMSAAFAKLYGEPLFKLPTDLYIPPDALEVFLEAFEGPLDLLLYLIRKQNFNVLDIPMAQVTQQYLSYIDQIRHHNSRPCRISALVRYQNCAVGKQDRCRPDARERKPHRPWLGFVNRLVVAYLIAVPLSHGVDVSNGIHVRERDNGNQGRLRDLDSVELIMAIARVTADE